MRDSRLLQAVPGIVCIALAAILTSTLLADNALASPVTYACTALAKSPGSTYMFDSDQIVIDVERDMVDLRISRTVGTSNPTNWIFTNRPGPIAPDKFTIQRDGGKIVGAGIYSGYAHSFTLTGAGLLTWVLIADDEPIWKQWSCRP